ncbi:hypothetical protein ACU8OO_34825 (plasmid) [Rhizobium leguminosarum]
MTAVNGDNGLNFNDLFGGSFASFLSDGLLKCYCLATRAPIQIRSQASFETRACRVYLKKLLLTAVNGRNPLFYIDFWVTSLWVQIRSKRSSEAIATSVNYGHGSSNVLSANLDRNHQPK